MKAGGFDRRFGDGVEDIIDDVDSSSWRRPTREEGRGNVGLQVWMVDSLDREAQRLEATRWSIIKVRIAERLEQQPNASCPPGAPPGSRRPHVPPLRSAC